MNHVTRFGASVFWRMPLWRALKPHSQSGAGSLWLNCRRWQEVCVGCCCHQWRRWQWWICVLLCFGPWRAHGGNVTAVKRAPLWLNIYYSEKAMVLRDLWRSHFKPRQRGTWNGISSAFCTSQWGSGLVQGCVLPPVIWKVVDWLLSFLVWLCG